MLRRLLARVPRPLRNLAQSPRQACANAWYRLDARVRGPRTIAVRPGWTVRCHPATAATFAHTRDDATLAREMDRFIASCRPGMRLVDVGSHYGVFTLAALHYGGPAASVVAIDPSVETQELLNTNLTLNGVRDRVELVRAAASDSEQPVALLSTGAGREYQMIRAETGRPDASAVPAVTLDGLAGRDQRRITHVKIDVEGQELAVLRGARRLLSEARPFLMLELHNHLLAHHGDRGATVLEVLKRHEYRWVSDGEGGVELRGEEVLGPWVTRLACEPLSAPPQ